MKEKRYISKELSAAIKDAGAIGFVKWDGRKKMFRDSKITKKEFIALDVKSRELGYKRRVTRIMNCDPLVWRVPYINSMVKAFDGIPYEDEFTREDAMSDWKKYQRPSRDGKTFIAICPGEPANRLLVDDPIAVAILTRKWREHYGK
jgi:hypothetical protein